MLIHLAVLAAVAWGVHGTIEEGLKQIGKYEWRLDPLWLVLAGLFYLAGMLPMGMFWYRALRAMGQHPRLGETLRAFYIGHLGKYVPGKALVVIIRAGLLRSERVNTGVAAASVFLETLTMMAVGAFLAGAMLVLWLRDFLTDDAYLIPLAVGLMLLSGIPTLPPVFRRAVLMLGVGRSDPQLAEKLRGLNFGVMATGWLSVSAGWVMLALSLWAVLKGIGIDDAQPFGHLQFHLAAVTLAIVAGFLSLIPGGAGVREIILTAIVGKVYFGVVLPQALAIGKALGFAVVLRLVWLAAELIVAGVLYFGFRQSGSATTGAASAAEADD